MRWRALSLLPGLILLIADAVQAHHSHAPFYDLDEIVEVTGVVKSFRLINPHPEIVLEVTGSDDELVEIVVYAQAYAGQMREVGGWTDDSVKIGETITAVGHPGRGTVSSVMGQSVTTSLGDVLDMRFFELLKSAAPPSQE